MLARKLSLLVFIVIFGNIFPPGSFAAIPIKKREQTGQKLIRKINEASAVHISHSLQAEGVSSEPEQANKPDSGLIGSLAFGFGLLGIFPIAIVLGIIGMQRHRKQRGFAIAGLVLGILTIFLIVGVFLLIIYMN